MNQEDDRDHQQAGEDERARTTELDDGVGDPAGDGVGLGDLGTAAASQDGGDQRHRAGRDRDQAEQEGDDDPRVRARYGSQGSPVSTS